MNHLFRLLVFPGGLFALALGLLLAGLDRRLAARLQRRVGPPLLQPLLDVVKLLRKESLEPASAERAVFRWAPVLGFAGAALAASMLVVPGVGGGDGDTLVLLYLLAVPAIAFMLGGSASSSAFGAIGMSREMVLMLAYEGPLLLALLAVALRAGASSFSLAEIVRWQAAHGPFLLDPVVLPAALAYACFIPGNLGVVPFDVAEAESELAEGPLLEYSGPALALLKLTSALKRVVVLGLGVALFFPGAPAGSAAVNLAAFVAKCAALQTVAVTLARTITGRRRVDQAFRFYATWPTALGLVALVACALAR